MLKSWQRDVGSFSYESIIVNKDIYAVGIKPRPKKPPYPPIMPPDQFLKRFGIKKLKHNDKHLSLYKLSK